MAVHYKKAGIATFATSVEDVFNYMRGGDHRHIGFRRHKLIDAHNDEVTLEAEVYHPDGSTFTSLIVHTLKPPNRIDTAIFGGALDGARFSQVYCATPIGTQVDVEGDFPTYPATSEADGLKLIDGFLTILFAEDAMSLRG